MKKHHSMLALGLVAFALAGCGGGGGGGDDNGSALDEVPASASASAKGLVNYLSDLVDAVLAGETSEPVAVDTFDPPKPDNTEPEPLS